ncbi:MAG: rhodanese-related sulfurtransferase [Alphaproteobacteria bacterium]|jgi:UPF0176 protein
MNTDSPITISSFYHFAPMQDLSELKRRLLSEMKLQDIKGTITLAPEGINATIAGAPPALARLHALLRSLPMLRDLAPRLSHFSAMPFGRSKVKVKRELIALGASADPSFCVGRYVAPEDWNALISQADVTTIDTRNDYEYALGHFASAVNPATRHFKQMVKFTAQYLDPVKTPKIAMYCTGGIRCEKYSAYLLTQGFSEVYHLRGGVLAYLETIPKEASLWQGQCYVFDERVAVGHGLTKSEGVLMCRCGRAYFEGEACICAKAAA